jgi:hypothetical protein
VRVLALTLTAVAVLATPASAAIAAGTVTVKLTRAAKLGNPRKAGRYTIRASIGTLKFSARVSIKP